MSVQGSNNHGNEAWASNTNTGTNNIAMSSPHDIGGRITKAGTGAQIVLAPKKELLISDIMGPDVVRVYLGKNQQQFTVHANLLFDAGKVFEEIYSRLQPGQKIVLDAEQPSVFKFFVDYLYTKAIPSVRSNMTPVVQAERLKGLCQLAAFADKFSLKHEIQNKIMDSIQDGFLKLNRFPESGLVKSIYEHTKSGSKIRHFCVASLLFCLRSEYYKDDGSLPSIINANDEIMDDFLAAVRNLSLPDRDPRLRDCQGEEGCVECARGHHCQKFGYKPCAFHIHTVVEFTDEQEDNPPTSWNGAVSQDKTRDGEGCYLWAL